MKAKIVAITMIITVSAFANCGKTEVVSEDWIVYHSKKTTEPGWDRNVRMQPFGWNADGTPKFGTAIPAGKEIDRPSGEVEIEKAENE